MCINFQAVRRQNLLEEFGLDVPSAWEWPAEIWQDYKAPIIVDQGAGQQVLLATYGMIPKVHLPPGAHFATMNARAETLGSRRAFRDSWVHSRLCLVPMLGFYEPSYETGKAEKVKIGVQGWKPFAVAGLFRSWKDAEGDLTYSFTQITINADEHPLMSRMHKPGDEKRSLVILPKGEYEDWLNCRNPEAAYSFLKLYPASSMACSSAGSYGKSSAKAE